MNEQQAIAVVQRKRRELEISPDMAVSSAERAIVEHMKDRSRPGPVEHRIAWIIEYACDWGLVVVHVDDDSGDILEVVKSK